MVRKKAVKKGKSSQLTFLEYLAKNKKAADELRGLLAIGKESSKHQWRGLIATPPGTFLEDVVSCFKERTNIPLELPFFAAMSFVSAHLLKNGAYVDFAGQKVKPDLWTVLLAESGAGKSFATSQLKNAMGIKKTFPECVSGAAFLESMQDQNNDLWIRDEFGQLLKSLETQQGAEIKDYLLRIFSGDTIERKTKKGLVTVEDPALCILGMTVLETFSNCIDAESLLDGFAQRFSYVIAHKDENRKMIDFPIFDLRGYREKITAGWDKIQQSPMHESYKMDDDAMEAFKTSFRMLSTTSIPESFFRRIMFKGIKYALVYHFLNGDESDTLTRRDFAWAGRVSWLHLKDAAELLNTHVTSDLERTLQNVETIRDRLLEQGKAVTPRLIVQGVKSIKTVAEARAVLSLVADSSQDVNPFFKGDENA